ncbi:MAG: DMT family protein [Chitinophagales bacterium]
MIGVLISWVITLFEYFFQLPANRIGYKENGGPFLLVELKVIQEVITLVVFTLFTLLFLGMKHCDGTIL